jgi:proline iminopeptidase
MPLMTPLFPALEPYSSTWLSDEQGSEIYVESSGDADAPTVLFVHGGPGSGASPRHRRYFNPSKWNIVLFDQRGCGRSRPLFELKTNTTAHLIEDMERVREALGLERWTLFGPSWGSTLALAYAQAHPDRVETLVIEGVLLGEREEMDWFHDPAGAGSIRPDALERLMQGVPTAYQTPLEFRHWALAQMQDEIAAGRPFLAGLEDPDTPLDTLQQSVLYRWSEYEETLGWLDKSNAEIKKDYAERGADWLTAHSLLEAWYFAHDCFLEPGQILDNAHRLTMPVHIIQSRYDLVCPGRASQRLAEVTPHARLHWVERSGHVMTTPVHREVRAVFEALASDRR